jgi:hypothetical protein
MPFHPFGCCRATITFTEAKEGNHRSKATNTTKEARQRRDLSEVGSIATITTEGAT